MRAMILAAGRGERMMPLTENTPKPMLEVTGKPLLQHHIENLVLAGITDIVINYAWCGEKIIEYFGDGSSFGANILYSDESNGALETAGGIKKALPLLVNNSADCFNFSSKCFSEDIFLVINGDIVCEYDFNQLPTLLPSQQACIWLVDNPEHNSLGDFCLTNNNVRNKNIKNKTEVENTYTFTGIALYRASFFRSLFDNKDNIPVALGPMLRAAADSEQLQGRLMTTLWADIGTPDRLMEINQLMIGRE